MPFASMLHGAFHQTQNMGVGKRIVDVLCLASPFDKMRREQNPQTGGYGRDLLALAFAQLRHASLARGEAHQKPQPFGIAKRRKHLGSGFDLRPLRKPNGRTPRMPAMLRGSVHAKIFYRSINRWTVEHIAPESCGARAVLDASRKPREALLKSPTKLGGFGLHFFPSVI